MFTINSLSYFTQLIYHCFRNLTGKTPIFFACDQPGGGTDQEVLHNQTVLRKLIDAGGNINLANFNGKLPISAALNPGWPHQQEARPNYGACAVLFGQTNLRLHKLPEDSRTDPNPANSYKPKNYSTLESPLERVAGATLHRLAQMDRFEAGLYSLYLMAFHDVDLSRENYCSRPKLPSQLDRALKSKPPREALDGVWVHDQGLHDPDQPHQKIDEAGMEQPIRDIARAKCLVRDFRNQFAPCALQTDSALTPTPRQALADNSPAVNVLQDRDLREKILEQTGLLIGRGLLWQHLFLYDRTEWRPDFVVREEGLHKFPEVLRDMERVANGVISPRELVEKYWRNFISWRAFIVEQLRPFEEARLRKDEARFRQMELLAPDEMVRRMLQVSGQHEDHAEGSGSEAAGGRTVYVEGGGRFGGEWEILGPEEQPGDSSANDATNNNSGQDDDGPSPHAPVSTPQTLDSAGTDMPSASEADSSGARSDGADDDQLSDLLFKYDPSSPSSSPGEHPAHTSSRSTNTAHVSRTSAPSSVRQERFPWWLLQVDEGGPSDEEDNELSSDDEPSARHPMLSDFLRQPPPSSARQTTRKEEKRRRRKARLEEKRRRRGLVDDATGPSVIPPASTAHSDVVVSAAADVASSSQSSSRLPLNSYGDESVLLKTARSFAEVLTPTARRRLAAAVTAVVIFKMALCHRSLPGGSLPKPKP